MGCQHWSLDRDQEVDNSGVAVVATDAFSPKGSVGDLTGDVSVCPIIATRAAFASAVLGRAPVGGMSSGW